MTAPTSDRIARIAIETLERTAFVMADHVSAEEAADLPVPTHFAAIGYSGPESGSIHLGASKGFLLELASSILGMDPDAIDPLSEGLDALSELANIVGGGVILDMGGDSTYFKLGLPQRVAEDASSSQDGAVVTHLDTEGELLRITWSPTPLPQSAAA
ncbi:MAG: chemotaxis protein CheX [Planctomycetota bacterium]|jgi:CheY-specific phosphatase CheX